MNYYIRQTGFFVSLFVFLFFSTSSIASDVFFKDMSGTNYLLPNNYSDKLGIGWVRQDLSWIDVESQKGVYNWSKFDEKVKQASAQNLKVLPMLAYTPKFYQTVLNKKSSEPNNYQAWLQFVTEAVNRYSREPYNIHYFQIWNEPTKKAGFWIGNNQDYIDKIYIPAAKIIKKNGSFVVFGGWPISNSFNELMSVLDYHDAWKFTDIIDFHYGPRKYYTPLYNKYVATNKVKGIWETEMGFRDGPFLVSKAYLFRLEWALNHNWDNPEKYVSFWYPAWANGGNSQRALSTVAPDKKNILTENGIELQTLNNLVGDGNLSKLSSKSSILVNNENIRISGFNVGNKKEIYALYFSPKKAPQTIDISAKSHKEISAITALTVSNDLLENQSKINGSRATISLNLNSIKEMCLSCEEVVFYIKIINKN
ncbi:hypothetical protein ACL2XG_24825 [Sodalis sp. RH24]|uniref:hypothetical protein n=1 Tax=unclassified Sodalis (in: enterobacteria) TaxID=2636512 RepID=UPI0039B366DE